MKREYFEWWVGLLIVIAVLSGLFLAFRVSTPTSMSSAKNNYHFTAEFDNIGGLKPRAKIAMAGVTIGRVESISLDPKTYQAKVSMVVYDNQLAIPTDSTISILTSGLLGDNFLGITPGSEQKNMQSGDSFEETHSALSLEHLVSQFVTSPASSGSGSKG